MARETIHEGEGGGENEEEGNDSEKNKIRRRPLPRGRCKGTFLPHLCGPVDVLSRRWGRRECGEARGGWMRPAKRATRGEGEGGIPQGGDGEWKALPRGRWTKTPNRAREPTFPSNLEGEWLLLKSVATAVSQILLVLFASQPCYSSWKVNPPEVAASPSFRLPSWQPCPASPLLFAGEEDDERRRTTPRSRSQEEESSVL